jgi:TATA-box binding protein (TBP) (component of TFIID and TFIIIB)
MITEKRLPSREMRYNDLIGVVSINLEDDQDFNALGASLAGYNPSRFKAVALRVYMEKSPVITIYAIDKEYQGKPLDGKMPVHKFKIEMSLDELFYRIKNINFTVTEGEQDIDNMEVINK